MTTTFVGQAQPFRVRKKLCRGKYSPVSAVLNNRVSDVKPHE